MARGAPDEAHFQESGSDRILPLPILSILRGIRTYLLGRSKAGRKDTRLGCDKTHMLYRSATSLLLSLRYPLILSHTIQRNMSSDSSIEAVRLAKQQLRKQVRQQLKQADTTRSRLVWDRLHALPEYQQAQSIALFVSMPAGEIDTTYALQHAFENTKTLYVPRVGANFERADMELVQVKHLQLDEWPRNKWQIPEPPSDWPVLQLDSDSVDLMVLPGVAFDRSGHRLGQGKGYYDRYLAQLKTNGKVSVGLDCQLVDEVPVGPYDQPADVVLVPNETIVVRR